MPFIVIEDPAPYCAKISKLRRHIIMFELVFHKKEIPQGAGVGPNRIEQDRSGGAGDHQKFPRGFGAGKIVPMFEELEDEHSGDDGEGDANRKNSRILRRPLPPPLGTRNWI